MKKIFACGGWGHSTAQQISCRAYPLLNPEPNSFLIVKMMQMSVYEF